MNPMPHLPSCGPRGQAGVGEPSAGEHYDLRAFGGLPQDSAPADRRGDDDHWWDDVPTEH